jgi:hypothetical protein
MSKPSQLLEEILRFVEGSSGLQIKSLVQGVVKISQSVDGKEFQFNSQNLDDVLSRMDSEGKEFIQINFVDGVKVLFTETLVGFKPTETFGLDMAKIPKVVTTPDLLSVFEAIEDTMSADIGNEHEVEILKKVYQSILQGGELAGFNLKAERAWLSRLVATRIKACA